MPEGNREIMQFKIVLNGSKPKIWRRILVPAEYTFFDLHCAIQDAMGWAGGHLHSFHIDKKGDRGMITIEFPDPENDDFFRKETCDERKELIADYFGKMMKQCIYCYDFGDSWDHTIIFEKLLPKKQKIIYPQCVAGKNACPPEDCGGLGGYEDLQNILKNPSHSEHANMLEWLSMEDPDEFDPYFFELQEVKFSNPKKLLKEWEKGFGI